VPCQGLDWIASLGTPLVQGYTSMQLWDGFRVRGATRMEGFSGTLVSSRRVLTNPLMALVTLK